MRTIRKTFTLAALAGLLSAVGGSSPATAQDEAADLRLTAIDVPAHAPAAPADTATGTIVDVAAAAGQFETLLAAAQAAGLAETLAGEGPFTVFAPTDEAFAALPDGTLASLLEAPDRLRSVLTYHVVSGEVTSDRVAGMDQAETVNGAPVQFTVRDGVVRVNDARVVTADVQASNGVIHVIDAVLQPPEK